MQNAFTNVIWPAFKGVRYYKNVVKGHTPLAFKSILKSTMKEIDRIRVKIGRFDEAVKKGRVFHIEDIYALHRCQGAKLTTTQLLQLADEIKQFRNTGKAKQKLAGEIQVGVSTMQRYVRIFKTGKIPTPKSEAFDITKKEDILATFHHYLPDWPRSGLSLQVRVKII